jgi:hypothetical protein
MRRRRRVWIFGKVCECSLEALRELYFRRSGSRSVECSEKNGHYENGKRMMIIVKKTRRYDIRNTGDLHSELCHAPKSGMDCKFANVAPICIGRSVRCLSEINGTAVRIP